ncbi:MAG: nicotinate (nicotinamide) nucleotide adenylyltransferase [Bacteroidales bacterium]
MTKPITGLLFGSFNPVHTGHLIIAQHFVQHTEVGEVWFVLSPQNPFKTEEEMLSEEGRMELLRLAVEDNPSFRICDIELFMEKPSYTIHTIKRLKTLHPERAFVLLIGSDNLEAFDQWKNYEEILSLLTVFVYPRSDDQASPFSTRPNVRPIDAPRLEISSTGIRQDLAKSKDPRYLLPEKVRKCILEKGYYTLPRDLTN